MAILRNVWLQALLTVAAVAAALLLAEMALRGYQALKARSAQPLGFIEPDGRLGWKARASLASGFRLFGDVNAARPKLLVIGDSFTQAVNVPSDKTYPAVLGRALDLEVFSYGGGGFGTLQELMVLEEFIEAIDPDIVLLQFCSNDFINNSFALESKSRINNLGLLRPYFGSGGAVVYRNPFFESPLLSHLLQRSSLFRSLAVRLYARSGDSVELALVANPAHPEFQESMAVTRTLLDRFKHRVGSGRKLVVFTAEGARTTTPTVPAQYQAYMALAERALAQILAGLQIEFLAGVPDAVADMEATGAVLKESDGAHWNELGHRSVGGWIQRSAAFDALRRRQEGPD